MVMSEFAIQFCRRKNTPFKERSTTTRLKTESIGLERERVAIVKEIST